MFDFLKKVPPSSTNGSGGHRTDRVRKMAKMTEVADSVSAKADDINATLSRWASAPDPFMAMFSQGVLNRQLDHVADDDKKRGHL